MTRIYMPERIQEPISGGFFIGKHLLVIGMPVEVLEICLPICLIICGKKAVLPFLVSFRVLRVSCLPS